MAAKKGIRRVQKMTGVIKIDSVDPFHSHEWITFFVNSPTRSYKKTHKHKNHHLPKSSDPEGNRILVDSLVF